MKSKDIQKSSSYEVIHDDSIESFLYWWQLAIELILADLWTKGKYGYHLRDYKHR